MDERSSAHASCTSGFGGTKCFPGGVSLDARRRPCGLCGLLHMRCCPLADERAERKTQTRSHEDQSLGFQGTRDRVFPARPAQFFHTCLRGSKMICPRLEENSEHQDPGPLFSLLQVQRESAGGSAPHRRPGGPAAPPPPGDEGHGDAPANAGAPTHIFLARKSTQAHSFPLIRKWHPAARGSGRTFRDRVNNRHTHVPRLQLQCPSGLGPGNRAMQKPGSLPPKAPTASGPGYPPLFHPLSGHPPSTC